MESVTLTALDGYKLSLSVFENASSRGCVQIVHGMEEHKERYYPFAGKLLQMGYTVIVSDLRGHGKTAPCKGFFKEKDGYKFLIEDQIRITKYIRERFGVERVYILGHSMGSIIVRNLLQTESHNYEKVVLTGYPNCPEEGRIKFGLSATKFLGRIFGQKHYSNFVQQAGVGMFNKSVKNPKTPVDWICTDEEVVQAYIKDPYCGHGFTVSGFHDLFVLTIRMAKTELYHNVNASLPILMMRGKEDAAAGFEEGAAESVKTLKKAGFSNVRTITYENMRHEILNEIGKEKVYSDIISFYRET
jgi:alpha-beta hydrolase superfamily lysophospholipase